VLQQTSSNPTRDFLWDSNQVTAGHSRIFQDFSCNQALVEFAWDMLGNLLGVHSVKFLHYIFNPAFWVCPYLTQNWVKTTQHFLECMLGIIVLLEGPMLPKL